MHAAQLAAVEPNHIKCLDGLDVGECLLIKTGHFGVHGGNALVCFPHTVEHVACGEDADRHADHGDQRKPRIMVKDHNKGADETHGIYNKIRNPAQNAVRDRGGIVAPACQ